MKNLYHKNRSVVLALSAVVCFNSCVQKVPQASVDQPAGSVEVVEVKSAKDQKIYELISQMTLEEKAGQLNFLVGDLFYTGPTTRTAESDRFDEQIRKGQLTGLFNIHGAKYTGRLQKIAVEESRLGIPLLFGADIIHGFKTVFPIPLASAASWDLEAIEKAERIAAIESTAAGISYTFAPMVDISRDARWGRVAEGAGEDPYLGSLVARARIRGFQGANLAQPNTMAATAKHFAAYGAAEAGRDYNTVDMSERHLREIYLPPFEAAAEEGVASFMNAFNELDGVPASANEFLLKDILRGEWAWEGVVVSDWNSIGEMLTHGYSASREEAARQALLAGTDIDMMSYIYQEQLARLVQAGKLEEKVLDQAVRRVLELKWDLGLFEDPYRYSRPERENSEILTAAHRAAARDLARKSIVLLKNPNNLLPLPKAGKKLAVIGPLADKPAEMNGMWSFFGEPQHAVSILQGIKNAVADSSMVQYAEGVQLYNDSRDGIAKALAIAQNADLVLMVVGESAVMSGEGASRANIGLPGIQEELVKEVQKLGKPMVIVLQNGRPLAIEWIDKSGPAILETWALGSESGNAIADVLFGDYNPSGKLPMTFPRHVGQIPISYNHKNTGRPYSGDYSEPGSERVYSSRYRDIRNEPLYPFGYGLSYTTFEYGELVLSTQNMQEKDTLQISIQVKNTGARDGEEVVQLYLRDVAASVTRPVKELKGFKKINLEAGSAKEVTFELTVSDLAFYTKNREKKAEPGEFLLFVGPNSQEGKQSSFYLSIGAELVKQP